MITVESNIVQVLRLDDDLHEPCYLTKTAMYPNAIEFIRKLREPHGRIYKIRNVMYEDINEWEEEIAWYAVKMPHVPGPMDASYNEFIKNFEILWSIGKELS